MAPMYSPEHPNEEELNRTEEVDADQEWRKGQAAGESQNMSLAIR